MSIPTEHITGLVLAGGRGSRLGGVDKGLQPHAGQPLAWHALDRLRPQVGALALNANRNLVHYQAMGLPVWPDEHAGFPGPLAGWLAGLRQCNTPWLVSVPCDTPNFPSDLVARLAAATAGTQADLVMAATQEQGRLLRQPVFALMRCSLIDSLAAALSAGERKVERWAGTQHRIDVVFDDAAAFFNVNTPDDLRQLRAG